MGVIQNSMNSVTAAAAAAAIAYDKSLEAKEMQQEKGLLAKEQYHEANAELTKLEGESEEASKALQEATTNYDTLMAKNPGGKGNTKVALEERRGQALTEKEAAQRAFNELSDKIEAKKALKLRTESIMKRTGLLEDKK